MERALYEFAHTEERSLDSLQMTSQYGAGHFYEQVRSRAFHRLHAEREHLNANHRNFDEIKEAMSIQFFEEILQGADIESLADKYMADRNRNDLEMVSASDDLPQGSPEKDDFIWVMNNYIKSGLVDIEGTNVRITPKGTQRLARYILSKVMETIDSVSPGTNPATEDGLGVTESCSIRPHEFGDDFWRIDSEATLLQALTKKGCSGDTICFDNTDLMVRETIQESRYVNGLIIDESDSMNGEKLHAAIDIALAMAELVGKNRNDSLNIFLFSRMVREVQRWEIANTRFLGGTTDIRSALKHARIAMRAKQGSKQVYIITDSEPNTENGEFIGFNMAARGVLGEAKNYRAEGITLNVIMLARSPHLRQLAAVLAKQNLGRVFFTEPVDLGTLIVQDYLKGKRYRSRNKRRFF